MRNLKVSRDPVSDRPGRYCWVLERLRPIFGWAFVTRFYVDEDAPEIDVVEFALHYAGSVR